MTNREYLPYVMLYPGDIYITKTPKIVTTNLGSCVSVTFFNPEFQIGALCHGRLPQQKTGQTPIFEDKKICFKYMDCSLLYILKFFKNHDINLKKLIINIYGGAEVLEKMPGNQKSVGWQNIDMAQKILRKHGLHACFSDVGGHAGRKITFNTRTGNISSTQLRSREEALQKTFQLQKAI